MTELPIIAGLIASTIHVISGPDHLAAVTPLAIETKRKAWRIGSVWGLGHISAMLFIGMLYIVFQDLIPVGLISANSELLVGILLILLGLWALYSYYRGNAITAPRHLHLANGLSNYQRIGAEVHHQHDASPGQRIEKSSKRIYSSLGIGFVHGMAGINHFLLLLPALAFERQDQSVLYVGGFAIGTVMAMTIYTFFLGRIVLKSKQSRHISFNSIRLVSGLFTLFVGLYWTYLSA